MNQKERPEQTILNVTRFRKSRADELTADPAPHHANRPADYRSIERAGNGMRVHGSVGNSNTHSRSVADKFSFASRGTDVLTASAMEKAKETESRTENSLAWEVAQIKVAFQTLHDEMREKHANCSEQTSKLAQEVEDLKQRQLAQEVEDLKQRPLAQEVEDLKQRQQEFPPAQRQDGALAYLQEQTAAHAEKISALARSVEKLEQHQQQLGETFHYDLQLRKEKEAEEGMRLQQHQQQGTHEVEPSPTDLDHHLQGTDTTKEKYPDEPRNPCHLTSETLFDQTCGYTVEESIWDSSIFVGFECTGAFSSIVIVLGILLTIAMEGSFVMVVFANYRNHELSEDLLDGLLHWRAVVAHDIQNYDPASKTSLASRVCMEEMSTDRSALQLQLFTDFHWFRNSPLEGFHFLNGKYLCNLALVLWFFSIVHDIIVNVRFTCSVVGHSRTGSVIVHKEDEFRIISFSQTQICIVVCFVTLPRLLIALFLGYVGLYFLAHTSKVSELLLNAVALVFVLEIDEMLFYALLPQRVKHLTWNVCPLDNRTPGGIPLQALRGVRHFAENLWVRLFIVAALQIWANIAILHPFTDKLDLALHYICDGNTDLIYTTNQLNDVIFYAESPIFEFKEAHKMTYQKRAVLEIIGMDPALLHGKVGDLPDAFNYQNSAIKSTVPALSRLAFGSRLHASTTAMCIDHTDRSNVDSIFPGVKAEEVYQSTQLLMRDLYKPDFESCSEINFELDCLSGNITAFRALCPRTCGCDNPWSGQFFAVGVAGCASNCETRWQLNLFYETPAHLAKYTDSCEDVPVRVLKEDISWKRYTIGITTYLAKFEPKSMVDFVQEQLLLRGCGYLTVLRLRIDICSASENLFRSARYYCPATCMCAVSDMQECPDSCRYSLPHQQMSPGLSCPIGLEILSREECEIAADEVYSRVLLVSSSPNTVPRGCYSSHGDLVYAIGTKNMSVPSDYLALCKSSQPFLPNSVSKGSYHLGKECADCIIKNAKCPDECFYGRTGHDDSGHH